MSGKALGAPARTIQQVVDKNCDPYQATVTSNLWDDDPGCFSHPTVGNLVKPFTTGAEYFTDFVAECNGASSEICIAGWQVNWDAQLNADGLRLYDVILDAARRGVEIYVMPWCHSNPVQTYDYQTAIVFDEINKVLKLGAKKRVHVARAESQAIVNQKYFSHHQKQVIIDRKIAYVGGIDLSYGRFDDATYTLKADAAGRQVMNRYNPGVPAREALPEDSPILVDPDLMSGYQDSRPTVKDPYRDRGYGKPREMESSELEKNQKKIDNGGWQVPYEEASVPEMLLNKASFDDDTPDRHTLDPSAQPRMPWQDLHCRMEGPAVSGLLRNFVVRWNTQKVPPKLPLPSPGAYTKLGNLHVQVLRSAPAAMVKAEAKATPKAGVRADGQPKPTATENHIQRTYLRLIEKAHRFIYIENQFFVSAFGEQNPEPGSELSPAAQFINLYGGSDQNSGIRTANLLDYNKKWLSTDLKDLFMPPSNPICKTLIERIQRAILDSRQSHFHVYITLPVHPEGKLSVASIAVQVYWTMQTIAHGSHSLLNGVRRGFKAREFLDEQQAKGKCVTLEQALAYANALPADQLDPDDERWKEYVTLLNLRTWEKLGERVVTEQIYVHTKLMIVDDRYAIFGSANINDRSQLGDRDSELAVLIHDGDTARADINGKGSQQLVRPFAHELRKSIWKKLFGITGGVRPASDLISAIEAPGSPDSWRRIQAQAEKNAEAYEAAFPFVPRSWSEDRRGNRTPARIIPNWDSGKDNPRNSKVMGYPSSRLPFEPEFWDAPQQNKAGIAQLASIKGFFTALPVHWLQGENVRFDYPTEMVADNKLPQQQGEPESASAETTVARNERSGSSEKETIWS